MNVAKRTGVLDAAVPDPLAPIWQVPPEPVHHPFPLPPSEPSEFDPALTAHSLPFSKPAPKRLCRKSQAKRRMQLTSPPRSAAAA